MSFINKLLRKTAPLPPLEDATAPLDPCAPSMPTSQDPTCEEASTDVAQAPLVPTTDSTETAANNTAAAAENALNTENISPEDDSAWWQSESDPPSNAPLSAPDHPTAPLRQMSARTIVGPTQPLQLLDPPEPTNDIVDPEELDGTRPLTAADVPMLRALRSHRGLAFGTLRDVGRVRSNNQDSAFAMVTTLPRENTDVQMGLFIVADGMGGHHGGEIASRLAISTVAHYVLAQLVVPSLADGTTEALQPMMVAAVQEANRTIWEYSQNIGSDMGTTCTVVLLLGRALYIGHVGDSRAYLSTPTGMRLITNDHSTVGRLIQMGQLDPSEAREHPLRSQLYRTVGQQRDIQVDFAYEQIGDATHLLIGSDGLWGQLDESVLQDVLEHNIWPQDACHELIARANLAGGDDNITAIVVTLPTS